MRSQIKKRTLTSALFRLLGLDFIDHLQGIDLLWYDISEDVRDADQSIISRSPTKMPALVRVWALSF